MSLFSYNPDTVDVLIAGFIPVKGFIDGTFISIDKDVQPSTAARTPDGTVARVKNNDATYTIQCTLHNGSESNDLLTKLWQLDEISQGKAKFPLLLKDQSGTDLFFSTTSWIEQVPALVKSTSIDSRTWTIRSAFAVINIGGNGEVSSLLEDIANSVFSAAGGLGNV
ncbi:hypothetical protein D3C84_587000 [compost metagenome]